MTELADKATHAAWWSMLEIGARYGVQIIVTIILARLLTPNDFGLLAMLLVFTTLGALLVDSGFGTALIQRQQLTDDDETTVFVYAVVSGTVLGTLLWLSAPLVADFYHEPRLAPLTRLVAWTLPLGGLAAVPDALLTKKLRFRQRTHSQVIASMLSGALAIALAWEGYGPWSIAWQSVTAMAIRTATLWGYAHWRPSGRYRRSSFRKLFGFGGYMLLTRMLDAVYMRGQAVLLGRLFDASTLGYYTLAQNAQQAPANFMGTVLNRVGLPVFSELAHQPDKLRAALRMTLRVSLFLFFPCMIGLAIAAKPVIVYVYGSKWVDSAPILSLLALATSLWPLHVLNLAALAALGRSDLMLRLELIKKGIALPMVIVASLFGPIAIAGAILVNSLISIIVNTHFTKKMLDYGAWRQVADQSTTLLLCGFASIPAWLILHTTRSDLVSVMLAIAAAGFTYLVSASFIHNSALHELRNLLRSLRPSFKGPDTPA